MREKTINGFANPIRNCPRTSMTGLVFRSKEEEFEKNRENEIEMLERVFKANPHLKFKWETAEDYLYVFDYVPSGISWEWAEMYVVDELELRNSCWPFNKAEYYNPYWNMTKEEVMELSKEMEAVYGK